jgi:hypothetical protein
VGAVNLSGNDNFASAIFHSNLRKVRGYMEQPFPNAGDIYTYSVIKEEKLMSDFYQSE